MDTPRSRQPSALGRLVCGTTYYLRVDGDERSLDSTSRALTHGEHHRLYFAHCHPPTPLCPMGIPTPVRIVSHLCFSLCLLSGTAPRGIPLLCLRPIEHLQLSTYPTTLVTATAAVLLPHPIALTDFRGTFRHRNGDNPPRHHPSTYKYME